MGSSSAPTIDEFRPAVLRVLADGREWRIQDLRQVVVEALQLSSEVQREELPSGGSRCFNRLSWAVSSFVKSGLIERTRRGHYRITANGLAVDARRLRSYSENDMLEWDRWVKYQEEVSARARREEQRDLPPAPAVVEEQDERPEELIEQLVERFNAETATELRRRLQESAPEFFERAVIELLWAMGYGGPHGAKRHVGRAGDGGIDGVIRQDALGLTNVYIQAKRYADTSTVGGPEIRNFMGALDVHGADRGVFITTSAFTADARNAANGYRHGKIVLIDGVALTQLMLEHSVAVHAVRSFSLFSVDEDFFEDELG